MKISIIFLFLSFSIIIFAQNDTTLTLQESESLFLKNNFALMAAQFNIDASKASIIQARLWENPTLTSSLNAYNPDRKKYFDVGTAGEKAFGIEQLIYLGGKKRNEVSLARTNAQIAELVFADLLRNLKLQLRQSYFEAYYDNLSYTAISQQITNLDSLISAYSNQVQKGNLPMKDLVRLQSLYLGFKQQKSELHISIIENQRDLQILTGLSKVIMPKPSDNELLVYQTNNILPLDTLKNFALSNRTDLKISQKQVEASKWNVKLQKSLAIPDVSLGIGWDQRGGPFQNQTGLTIGIPLPLWNRNQGNIKVAKSQLNETTVQQNLKGNTVLDEVDVAYQKWLDAFSNFELLSPESIKNFNDVEAGVLKNFKNGNISLIEFTDFMESYNVSLMQYHQFSKNLINACEEINCTTNSKIF